MNASIVNEIGTEIAVNTSPIEVNGKYAFILLLLVPGKERYGHSSISDLAGLSEMSIFESGIFESL